MIAPVRREMPPGDEPDYEYAPKPPETDAPVTRYEFKMRFYACNMRCSILQKTIFRPFHRCRRFSDVSQAATVRIPKRNSRLDGYARQYFWGLYAVEISSFFRFMVYLTLALALPLTFWFLWLFYWKRQADLQNASVPFFAVVTFVSLLWFYVTQT